ncbi:hypothetical protein E3P92_02194 [Wallemia ichthyophaga]|uniref:Uncharacterized protein n=2 Tax=Wallemia ichthyophaga TaxID=245174 RepID=A0A4T0IT19_WALIC|nr:Vacuolar ATPase assembly integral membrane protein VMA21 [Wallemia ichthyophaga EXF-994]TIA72584.1 hypothetical protein E3P91_01945 [Wallemia ichthyophaga]EOR03602.1 Vacuolar ATPase assembly integral membrane protein VMA21 [Wallemia ichthyophaga EXF-994]TIA77782.1 hypothetical protein E3P98_04089 [Wallemia ichthyophaga]TIA91356.1 hypothetical protein E3P97_02072 [Wallemia ichthyophaga]TIA94736.1 hypothetical protein E3P95_04099 [Wallemia ichthyophaga]
MAGASNRKFQDKLQSQAKSNEAVTRSSMSKLIAFSLALVLLPISVYFVSLNRIFTGNSTYAAITAAITANVVLISYVAMAILEDDSGIKQKKSE